MYGISFSKDIIDSDNYIIALFITVGPSIPTVHLQRHSTYQAIYMYRIHLFTGAVSINTV